MPGYPVDYNIFWYGLPDDLQKFDAVYERVDDGKIVFFSGKSVQTQLHKDISTILYSFYKKKPNILYAISITDKFKFLGKVSKILSVVLPAPWQRRMSAWLPSTIGLLLFVWKKTVKE